jgi:hypothetical protein
MTRGAQQEATLVKDLQQQVKLLEADLRTRTDEASDSWGQQLRAEYDTARARGRTALTWTEWRDGEIALAAVAWVLGTVFIRFCEDNDLIDGAWITGEGARHGQAADNESAFFQSNPTANQRDWLREGFAALSSLPAGKALLDEQNLVWRSSISADAAAALLSFWRRQDEDGTLRHDLTDPTWSTRFLGDLYQDLSDFAKKKYALLQTPDFIEEFILDRTLSPAINEFGLEGLKMIDPTCGSGHFLLGAFGRLNKEWQIKEPGTDPRVRVQKALDSVHGIDLNPFAVAIARFRLTLAAMQAAGIARFKDAPAFAYHLVVGDSLLYGHSGVQGSLLDGPDQLGIDFTMGAEESFQYSNEDIAQEPHILDRGRYHVVVGNPPYITVKDKALNEAYRAAYSTCKGKYALSVPFMELFFELAVKDGETPAGFVGQITSNSFMKREFGSKVIEDLLSGTGALSLTNPVDLRYVVDTSGAYIPGHGTPTVILIGRRRKPVGDSLRAVLGVRGEPGQPAIAAEGLVWTQIRNNVDGLGLNGEYVTISDLARSALATFPWSLSGGRSSDLKALLEAGAQATLHDMISAAGIVAVIGEEEAFEVPEHLAEPMIPFVSGEAIRDYKLSTTPRLWPYTPEFLPELSVANSKHLWPRKRTVRGCLMFGQTREERGLQWFEYGMFAREKAREPLSLAFAFVATHNHFVLDRGGKVFKQSAPVIKLPEGATEREYLDLLGILNSSAACFWLKQVCHDKGNGGIGGGIADQEWERFYEFTGTKLQEFPLPASFPADHAQQLDALAQLASNGLPAEGLSNGVSDAEIVIARERWHALRAQMIFVQEELDWEVYRLYGLIEKDLTYSGSGVNMLDLGNRAFEIFLARKIADGSEESAWFERHGSTPIVDLPSSWSPDYSDLVQRRLDLIASDPFIGLLERPEYKRRWQSASFDNLLPQALRDFILDRLEERSLWSDSAGPQALSVAQLADRVRGNADLVEAVKLLLGAVDVDLTGELAKLISDEAVPFLAANRYKDSGMRKRAEWEQVWELQRREDAGERVSIPVPPKYGPTDFRKTAYWQARGKLDVPKERFISYPGAERAGDGSMIIGWAGWDHLEQARALARLLAERMAADDISPEARLPLLAGLVELEPWLHQWHAEASPEFGGSPAVFMTGFIESQLAAIGKTREDCKAWRP